MRAFFTFIVFPVFRWVGSRAESSECSGDDTLKNIVVVTDMWGEVSQAKGVMREARTSSTNKPLTEEHKCYDTITQWSPLMTFFDTWYGINLSLSKSNVSSSTKRRILDRRLLHRKSKANSRIDSEAPSRTQDTQVEMKGSNFFSPTFANLLLRSAPDERRRGLTRTRRRTQ